MTDKALVPTTTTSALDRLQRTAQRNSLDDFVNARTRRSVLLIDCSGSMSDRLLVGGRKVDKLRKVVTEIRTTHPVHMVGFGFSNGTVRLIESIPEPEDMTPLDRGIDFCKVQEANHIVLVTDGLPDSQTAAFDAARRFGGQIDVFYIGDGNDRGAAFCAELAKLTGGKCGVTDLLGDTKQLAGKVTALLGDGSGAL